MRSSDLPRIAVLILLAAAMAWLWIKRDIVNIQALETMIMDFGVWSPLVFIAVYAAIVPLCLPGSLATIVAGALFGPIFGSIYSVLGATLGATISFLIARYIAGNYAVSKWDGRLRDIKEGVEVGGWRFVAIVRLAPIFPFNVVNYLFGLTKISTTHYFLSSLVFMTPGAVAYTYVGYAGKQVAVGNEDTVLTVVMAGCMLIAVAMLPSLIRRWRQHFSKRVENGSNF